MSKNGCFSLVATIVITCAALALLLAACQPAATPTLQPTLPPAATLPPAKTAQPTAPVITATAAPASTGIPVQPTQPALSSSSALTLELGSLAKEQTVVTIPAVLPSAGQPWWATLPEHRAVTLQGYPLTGREPKPQIFLFPVSELARFSEAAGKEAAALQALLQNRQPGETLPFLPGFNAKQVIHPQVQYLDFKNGKGVRYLTQYNTGFVVINNVQLFYTFQGITNDGKTYVAAVLPVTHPELSATGAIFSQVASELPNYPAYLTKTAAWLDQQAANKFGPDLAKLDALIQSMTVK